MKTSKLKFLVLALVAFIFLVGGVFYYASTKLRPEEIRKMTIEQAQKVFPRSEVNLQSVNIGWGLSFKVNLEKLSIKAIKENQKVEMMSVDQLVATVPLWAIITGRGVVDIKLDAPVMGLMQWENSKLQRAKKRKKQKLRKKDWLQVQYWDFLVKVKSMSSFLTLQ
jgi:hypothetical protein